MNHLYFYALLLKDVVVTYYHHWQRLRYIETILQNWLNNNIKTVIQLEAYKNQRKEKGGVNNGPNSKNNGTTEATEDFFNGKLKEF